MTLASVDLYRYALPLRAPLQLPSQELRRRRGLLIRLKSSSGIVGWGDAAPLSDFSAETLDEVVAHGRVLRSRLENTTINPDAELDDLLQGLSLEKECPASLRFAVESAVLTLVAQVQDRSLPAVLGRPRRTIAVNALLTDPLEGGLEEAERLRDEGYEALKVKVGRGGVEEEAACVQALHRELGDVVTLRLDANRAWTVDEAVAFAEEIPDGAVEYVEEPVATPEDLKELADRRVFPIALDETTREVEPEFLEEMSSVAAVVLKPTLLGGIEATREWVQVAQVQGATSVVSAAYESGIGLHMLSALSATLPPVPVGLSTYSRLAADVLQSRLAIAGPVIEMKVLSSMPLEIDRSMLDPVDERSA